MSPPDFPSLKYFGRYAHDVKGDGNCLFRALSDQLYATQSHHQKIRLQIVQHMRQNPTKYRAFVVATLDGGSHESYNAYLTRMAQPGEWGDNIELQAFADLQHVDVFIYRPSHTAQERDKLRGGGGGGRGEGRPEVHLAFEPELHYLSARRVEGGGKQEKQSIGGRDGQKRTKSTTSNLHTEPSSAVDALGGNIALVRRRPEGGSIEAARRDLNNALDVLIRGNRVTE